MWVTMIALCEHSDIYIFTVLFSITVSAYNFYLACYFISNWRFVNMPRTFLVISVLSFSVSQTAAFLTNCSTHVYTPMQYYHIMLSRIQYVDRRSISFNKA